MPLLLLTGPTFCIFVRLFILFYDFQSRAFDSMVAIPCFQSLVFNPVPLIPCFQSHGVLSLLTQCNQTSRL